MLTEKDQQLIENKGITAEMIEKQIKRFESGFPQLRIHSVAKVGNGIMRLGQKDINHYIKLWRQSQQESVTIEKFVPASGAASRMFKNMFAFTTSGRTEPETDFEKQYFDNINHFAFYPALNKACDKLYKATIPQLIQDGKYVEIAKTMLESNGLNYGFLPKALLQFHRAAGGGVHTSLEEHLEEGAQYATNGKREVNIHFTVSPEHRKEFDKVLKAKLPAMEMVWGVKYKVTMSEQKQSTDTIAVNLDNTPYRDQEGNLFFRPAGHGALIENLNERDADVVFVKNIDNVVPLRLRNVTVRYKKAIGGYLIDVQRHIAKHLATLDKGASASELKNILKFVENRLCTRNEATAKMDEKQLIEYLRGKLNRPIRVCGMVLNEGEPGGGPYLAYNSDGSYSPQILEAAQIDENDPAAVELMKSGTHFNPVDLVCYIKDYKGNKFDLKQFVDPDTGLISMKSTGGVEIKALELPGLWNGSMSDWNTIFVEVPIETFNPVKTVNDLLRPQHQ
ncbi:MAG: DUF4301 family protein [Muribaculaceae bacterium]|nr:DUF4301 family protein [Muribaculaceae bacterium]